MEYQAQKGFKILTVKYFAVERERERERERKIRERLVFLRRTIRCYYL